MDKLYAIIESGSTKADLVILNASHDVVLRTQIQGLNPIFNTVEDKIEALNSVPNLKDLVPQIKSVQFYGAGCSNPQLQKEVVTALSTFFTDATCTADSDLLAACKAVYQNKTCLVGILGTGSNMCLYNGNTIHKEVPSLGYILGDEGSGNHLGKLLLRAYFSKQMPQELEVKFNESYSLTISEVLEHTYRQPRPNAYLAQFNKFIFEHKRKAFIQKLIEQSFEEFYLFQMQPYLHLDFEEVNFIGSIAFLYETELQKMANKYEFNLGHILQSPIETLIHQGKA